MCNIWMYKKWKKETSTLTNTWADTHVEPTGKHVARGKKVGNPVGSPRSDPCARLQHWFCAPSAASDEIQLSSSRIQGEGIGSSPLSSLHHVTEAPSEGYPHRGTGRQTEHILKYVGSVFFPHRRCWRCILLHQTCSLHFGLDLIMELTRH
jgi:hypothetical protein